MSLKFQWLAGLVLIVLVAGASALATQLQSAQFQHIFSQLHQLHWPTQTSLQAMSEQRYELEQRLFAFTQRRPNASEYRVEQAALLAHIARAQEDKHWKTLQDLLAESEVLAPLQRSRHAYFSALKQALADPSIVLEPVLAVASSYQHALAETAFALQQAEQHTAMQALALSQSPRLMQWLAWFVVAGLALWLAWLGVFRIFQPLTTLSLALKRARDEGEFVPVSAITNADELGQAQRRLAQLFERLRSFFSEAERMLTAWPQGEFSHRIRLDSAGAIHRSVVALNANAANLAHFCRQLDALSQACLEGESIAVDKLDNAPYYQGVSERLQRDLQAVNLGLVQMQAVMEKVALGHLGYRVSAPLQGRFALLKAALHQALDRLEQVVMEASRVVSTQAQGELSGFIEGEYEGELSQLVEALNNNLDNLDQVISSMMVQGGHLVEQADRLADHTRLTQARVQQKWALFADAPQSLESLSQGMQRNFAQSLKAYKLAKQVEDKSKQSHSLAHQAVTVVQEVQLSAQKLNEMMTLLDVMSFQTQVLALNATVEAGRAEVETPAFANVAAEVRSLAQKSAEIAKDIKLTVHESVTRALQAMQVVNQSMDVLKPLAQSSEYVTKIAGHLALSTKSQAGDVAQIQALVAQVHQRMSETRHLFDQASEQAGTMRHQVQALGRHIHFFKTSKNMIELQEVPREDCAWEYALIEPTIGSNQSDRPKRVAASD